MDVLGDPQLGDSRLLGRSAVARDVLGRERARECRAAVVGSEMEVIIG